MQNKKFKNIFFIILAIGVIFNLPVMAEENVDAEQISADAISNYNADGSVFQKITDLEQDKVMMQLEKERAQLDLDMDRLAAEKVKLQIEMDTIANNAEQEKQALAEQKARLEAEAERIEREKQSLSSRSNNVTKTEPVANKVQPEEKEESINDKYRLIDIIGAGNQLQATLENLENGQNKKISVGKILDGYTIQSISLDDGVVFVKEDITETLNIGKSK